MQFWRTNLTTVWTHFIIGTAKLGSNLLTTASTEALGKTQLALKTYNDEILPSPPGMMCLVKCLGRSYSMQKCDPLAKHEVPRLWWDSKLIREKRRTVTQLTFSTARNLIWTFIILNVHRTTDVIFLQSPEVKWVWARRKRLRIFSSKNHVTPLDLSNLSFPRSGALR
jgi:hypothetical protein